MRIFKYFAVAGVASASIRAKRSDEEIGFEVTGEETESALDLLLFDFGGESTDFERTTEGREGVEDEAKEVLGALNPRKFRQWKLMIQYLQGSGGHRWKDFQNYGCHCLPEGAKKISAMGYGAPVDAVDASCRSFHQCYRCLEDEHADETKGCNGEDTKYGFTAAKTNGVRAVTCTDPVGTCQYNACQCDLQLATRLAETGAEWDMSHHASQGGFDRDAQCIRGGNGNQFQECCGDKTTFPFNQIRRTGQCCIGSESKPLSQC